MATILLAEDDEAMRTFIARALVARSHTVTACADGDEAASAVHDGGPFDLLVTDIVMPGLDGLELSALFRKYNPASPVIFISGMTGANRNDGDGLVLSKPFHLNELMDKVMAALEPNNGAPA